MRHAKLGETSELENTMIILASDNGPGCEVPPHARTQMTFQRTLMDANDDHLPSSSERSRENS